MPGKVVKVLAQVGEEVKSGQPLLILEAMKMEHPVKADRDGVLEELMVEEGQQVEGGTLLAVVGDSA
jgi:propionyl-CoA carboxylase alpha chain